MHSKCFESRGPDNYGAEIHGNLGLCHRRLSIIDLDDRSNQPMQKASLTIVFNGEIYNFQQLKNELIELGIGFETASDTEVILSAYSYWGIDKTVEKLETNVKINREYMQQNNIVLFEGDCLDIMKNIADDSVDFMLGYHDP